MPHSSAARWKVTEHHRAEVCLPGGRALVQFPGRRERSRALVELTRRDQPAATRVPDQGRAQLAELRLGLAHHPHADARTLRHAGLGERSEAAVPPAEVRQLVEHQDLCGRAARGLQRAIEADRGELAKAAPTAAWGGLDHRRRRLASGLEEPAEDIGRLFLQERGQAPRRILYPESLDFG